MRTERRAAARTPRLQNRVATVVWHTKGHAARGLLNVSVEMSPEKSHKTAGFTMIEVAVVVALIGVLAAIASPNVTEWLRNQRVKSAAHSIADLFTVARADAIASGNAHIVFLSAAASGLPAATDPAGAPLGTDPGTGGAYPAIVIDDGALAAANCVIDAGERRREVLAERDVAWGFGPSGGTLAPQDTGGGNAATGSTFTDTAGTSATWVMFRPDGIPVPFDAACNIGAVGRGGGAIYVTNGVREYAVVLSPLGVARVHAWDAMRGQWTD
jgi:prepilin-type N-terminal cleavage/methylation domain-containing protein